MGGVRGQQIPSRFDPQKPSQQPAWPPPERSSFPSLSSSSSLDSRLKTPSLIPGRDISQPGSVCCVDSERKKPKAEKTQEGARGEEGDAAACHRASPTPRSGARGAPGGGEALQETAAPSPPRSLDYRTQADPDWTFTSRRSPEAEEGREGRPADGSRAAHPHLRSRSGSRVAWRRGMKSWCSTQGRRACRWGGTEMMSGRFLFHSTAPPFLIPSNTTKTRSTVTLSFHCWP
uniref:Uncharacterized protein n=1 Tax=Iconisemion striatum TaxID=60296 RepID=A0A1A7XT56_9TELE